MLTRTFQSLADDARARTDRKGDPSLENEDIAPWLNQQARNLWVMAARAGADEFTALSDTAILVPGQNEFNLVDLGVTDFMSLRGVDASNDGGTTFFRIKPYKFLDRNRGCGLSYWLRQTTFRIEPKALASTFRYRIWYVFRPTEWMSMGDPIPGGDSLDLPIGGDDYIVEGVCARIRVKYEEDPIFHLSAQKAAQETMQRWWSLKRQGEPEPIREADAEDYDWGW